MRNATPVRRHGVVGKTGHLFFGEHIPQPEFDLQPPIRLQHRRTADQRLRANHPPVGETRLLLRGSRGLDESLPVERTEQAGALQIGRHDPGDVTPDIDTLPLALEIGDRDGHRLGHAARDVDAQFGDSRQGGAQYQHADRESGGDEPTNGAAWNNP